VKVLRTEDYATRSALAPGGTRRIALLAQGQRRVRRRPRTEEELRMLSHMARVAIRRRESDGCLERIGPREYVMRTHGASDGSSAG